MSHVTSPSAGESISLDILPPESHQFPDYCNTITRSVRARTRGIRRFILRSMAHSRIARVNDAVYMYSEYLSYGCGQENKFRFGPAR